MFAMNIIDFIELTSSTTESSLGKFSAEKQSHIGTWRELAPCDNSPTALMDTFGKKEKAGLCMITLYLS